VDAPAPAPDAGLHRLVLEGGDGARGNALEHFVVILWGIFEAHDVAPSRVGYFSQNPGAGSICWITSTHVPDGSYTAKRRWPQASSRRGYAMARPPRERRSNSAAVSSTWTVMKIPLPLNLSGPGGWEGRSGDMKAIAKGCAPVAARYTNHDAANTTWKPTHRT